ncbi:MAG: carboxypeptidase-like regulatory domain-containing protein [Paludibacteraceae bacterium]|nr:carboxypeptidase-like regulatory domain-containing protein [Paludibacteraceae bacterium]
MRATCETLKSIRKQIADANGIAYEPNICTYEGPCMGTCPVCEAEARYLEAELAKRQKAHKGINIIGVAKDKMPAPSSFSQAIAAATITTVLSFTALPVAAVEQEENPSKTEQSNMVRVNGIVNNGYAALSGARISIEGSKASTQSDKDGNFSINASLGDILIIEYPGYESKSVTVNNTEKLTLSLFATPVSTRLAGAVSSLEVSEPPLYVVDGKLINCVDNNLDPFSSLKTSDILSMEILIDSASIAPYAMFCKNAYSGVILIKTKDGQK